MANGANGGLLPFCGPGGDHGVCEASLACGILCFRFGIDAPLQPVFAEQLGRMLRTFRTVAAGQRIGRAIFVAAPAETLGMYRVDGEFLGHVGTLLQRR